MFANGLTQKCSALQPTTSSCISMNGRNPSRRLLAAAPGRACQVRLATSPHPIVVEPSGNSGLDEKRRACRGRCAWLPAAAEITLERVIFSESEAEGLPGYEAVQVGGHLVFNQQSSSTGGSGIRSTGAVSNGIGTGGGIGGTGGISGGGYSARCFRWAEWDINHDLKIQAVARNHLSCE